MLDQQQQRARSIYRSLQVTSLLPGEDTNQKIKEAMMLIKITGVSVKFILSKYIQESLINMSLKLYISNIPE